MKRRTIVGRARRGAALAVCGIDGGGSVAAKACAPTASPCGFRSTRSPAGRTSSPHAPSSSSPPPGLERRRPVPELARPSAEVRRDARGENGARRHRDGQHRDDEVHGRRRVRGSDVQQVAVPELEQLAPGPRRLGRVQRQDLRRPVLRRLARGHLPHGPLQEGRDQEAPDEPRGVHAGRAEARREEHQEGFSPVYIAGTDWYVAMGFVYDRGGPIARFKNGKWVGTLDSAAGTGGVEGLQGLLPGRLEGEQDDDETQPHPYDVYAQGQAARSSGPRWFSCCVGTKYKAATKQFVMPSVVKGKSMPGFLGGSDLAIPARLTKAQADRLDQGLHEHELASGRCRRRATSPTPRTCSGTSVNERAAQRSWFVPTAKHWVDVENGNILRTMLAHILTGASIEQATGWASDNITFTAEPLPQPGRPSPSRPLPGPGGAAVADVAPVRPSSAPFLLIAPGAPRRRGVLGYPIYQLVTLSMQQYGLEELIAQKGVYAGSTTTAPCCTTRSSGTRSLRTIVFTAVNVGLTIGIGTALALLLVRVARRCGSSSPRGSCSSGRCPSSSPSRSGTG